MLSAPGATNTSTTLTWTASTDLGGSTLTGYVVYRDGVLIGAPTPATALTYTDTGAMSPGSYIYTVVRARRRRQQLARLEREDGRVRRDGARHADRARRDDADEREADPALDGHDRHRRSGHRALRRLPRAATLAGSTAVASFTDAALTQSGTNVYTSAPSTAPATSARRARP